MSTLKEYFSLIAGGESVYRAAVLRLLAREVLYIPVIGTQRAQNDEIDISVVTIVSREQRYFVAFTDELLLRGWAEKKCKVMPLSGAEFALSLPSDCPLIINPTYPDSLELSAHDIERIIDFAHDAGGEAQGVTPEPSANEGVLGALSDLLRSYHEVVQAFYLPPNEKYPAGLLGMLTHRLHADTRLLLVSEIGQISRASFGSAGALEIFDEEGVKRSSQWDLLRGVAPFYHRESADDALYISGANVLNAEQPNNQRLVSTERARKKT
jgi:hypothetical protein